VFAFSSVNVFAEENGLVSLVDLVENQCSPAWTYNFLAQDVDSGLVFSDAFEFLTYHGSVSLKTLPYDWQDCTTLPPDGAVRDALTTRISDSDSISIKTSSNTYKEDEDFEWIKQQLAQGELFYIGFLCGINGNNCDSVVLPNGDKLIYQVNDCF